MHRFTAMLMFQRLQQTLRMAGAMVRLLWLDADMLLMLLLLLLSCRLIKTILHSAKTSSGRAWQRSLRRPVQQLAQPAPVKAAGRLPA